MKNVHIAFISYPFPAFVNPTLPLVSTLVRRGYHVSYATTEGFVAKITALGAETITCPPILFGDDLGEAEDKDDNAFREFCAPMIDSVPKLLEFYDKHRPDLILHSNLAIGGHIVTARLGIPSVQFHSVFALDKDNLFRQIRDARHRQYVCEASRRSRSSSGTT